ncbi:MAG TPA: CAP domain-containing protein [Trebonia sp.]
MDRRARTLLFGLLALAVLVGGGLYAARGAFSADPAAGPAPVNSRTTTAGCGQAGACTGTTADVAVAAPPAVVRVPSPPASARAHPTPARTSPSASSSSPPPRPTASGSGTVVAQPSASASSSAAQDGTAAGQVLTLINQARSAAGLPGLTVTAGLESSSSAHNMLMAGGCGLSHQCPGEAAIGQRETDAGVDWTAAGENIGEGGPVADTDAAIAQMAVGLTQSMLDEQPPNDGHRMNILSTAFTHIGIAVYRDSAGTVWLTQDFSN